MEKGMLDLHNVLRWLILLFLLVVILQAIGKKPAIRKTSLWLLICTHLTFVVGLYLLLAGEKYGLLKGVLDRVNVMKNDSARFFILEHPLLMFVGVILITIARGKAKALNYKATAWLLFIALLFILAAIPWPFREIGAGRPWLPGM
jgi:cell division protein FtsW (lipid II flippase)